MRAVIQRVTSSSVTVGGKTAGAIGPGLNVLLCAMEGDTERHAQLLAKKIAQLRIFSDGQRPREDVLNVSTVQKANDSITKRPSAQKDKGKMNLSVTQTGGSILLISQFTLAADTRKGNRPGFTGAADPQTANALYERFAALLRENGVAKVETGIFGADMRVEIVNDGPVTIILDTNEWL